MTDTLIDCLTCWSAWWRKGARHPWQRVANCDAEPEAWRELLAALPRLGSGESLVVEGDLPPGRSR